MNIRAEALRIINKWVEATKEMGRKKDMKVAEYVLKAVLEYERYEDDGK